ncbi:futalosine hydrolase [Chitinophaga caeni]|uniref:Futalosine hydrolase n=1 Tax=Chitinophaga caeni TaxID=2029983 RepID=A0A291QTK1_9BACT|nr:futalosine hydrolase [Chitinophaga caeni]ATL47298.1 futalosine hydrolase [Chitinophaga caeni]
MKILLTAATILEIQPFLLHLEEVAQKLDNKLFSYKGHQLEVQVTGIGMMSTAYQLGKKFAVEKPGFVIQAGIAGCFHKSWELGEVVQVTVEHLGDLGAEDNDVIRDMFDIGLMKENEAPFTGNAIVNTSNNFFPQFRQAKGVTVNLVSGSKSTIERLTNVYAPDIESMEGAALHYVCNLENVPYLQLRSISNYVEVRDKSKWKIALAIKNLNHELVNMLDNLRLS